MSSPSADTSPKWHIASWPPLAWLETAIKAVAIAIGILALAQALSSATVRLPSGTGLVQLIVLAILSLGLVAAIFDRLIEREIVAMIFVIANNLGHWGMVFALASQPGPGPLLPAFAGLMLLGDLVKVIFLRRHQFSVRGRSGALLVGLTLFYVTGYALILALELFK